jgi:hypothetical protein
MDLVRYTVVLEKREQKSQRLRNRVECFVFSLFPESKGGTEFSKTRGSSIKEMDRIKEY